jgi:magnesium-transporting ATPase (P-type)
VQAQHGYRTLAVARGTEDTPLTLVGLVTLYDPPRPEAQTLIATLRDLGVAVKMLTGDALPVARAIAQRVGLTTVRRGADVAGDPDGGTVAFAHIDGLAEVYPAEKYAIVKGLQAAGHVVGMTGDGVNDAPALRQAEVGIAVRSATDVARGAASVVLTEEGLAHIVHLVEQGRIIYQRILTWIINKLSRTILKAGFVAIAYLWTGTFVVSAFSMMLLVFMTDFAKIALATDHVRWSKRPETWDLSGLVTGAAVLGVLMVVEALGLLAMGWHVWALGTHPEALATLSFQILLYFALFSIVSIREEQRFWASMPSRTLLVTLALDAIVGTLLSTVGMPGLPPLPWAQTIAVFTYAMLCSLGLNDMVKVKLIRRHRAALGEARAAGFP